MWSLRIGEMVRHKMLSSMGERKIHVENSEKSWRNFHVKLNKLF